MCQNNNISIYLYTERKKKYTNCVCRWYLPDIVLYVFKFICKSNDIFIYLYTRKIYIFIWIFSQYVSLVSTWHILVYDFICQSNSYICILKGRKKKHFYEMCHCMFSSFYIKIYVVGVYLTKMCMCIALYVKERKHSHIFVHKGRRKYTFIKYMCRWSLSHPLKLQHRVTRKQSTHTLKITSNWHIITLSIYVFWTL